MHERKVTILLYLACEHTVLEVKQLQKNIGSRTQERMVHNG